MKLNELEEYLQLIFDKEISDQKYEKKDLFNCPSLDLTKPIVYPNGQTLVDLFSNVSNEIELNKRVLERLKKEIIKAPEEQSASVMTYTFYCGISPLCFFALIESGFVNEAIDCLNLRIQTSYGITRLVNIYLEKNIFNYDQLNHLAKRYKDPDYSRKILDKKFNIFKKQLKTINLEINQDKIIVSQKIKNYGFSDKYNEYLNLIDEFIRTDASKVMNAGMISTLRSFMAELITDIANRIAFYEKETIPKYEGHQELGNIRIYLKKKLELSEKDHKLINAIVEVLHEEGAHSMMTNKEYFRLSKNIVIEVALFILLKYEQKYGIAK